MVPGRYPTVAKARAEEPAPTRPPNPASTSSMPSFGAAEGAPSVNPALASELSSWILQEAHRRDLGEDFSAPRPVDHTAYFRWRWSARRAATQLAALGCSTTVEKHRREVVLKARGSRRSMRHPSDPPLLRSSTSLRGTGAITTVGAHPSKQLHSSPFGGLKAGSLDAV